jgi:murein DD-endopeptidase MepM/ murein hydrolase activator NlpD
MHEDGGRRRAMALATLASALAWNFPALAVDANTGMGGAPSEAPFYHTVESGETLSGIADRYGTSVDRLMRENEVEDARSVWIGTRLRIPASAKRIPTRDAGASVGAEGSTPAEIGAALERCEAEVRAARFEQALATAAKVRGRLDAQSSAGDSQSRVRLEIASATAYVALGQADAALESLERALIAEPDLELDPALTSPKVLAVFRAARGRVPPRQ